MTYCSWRQLARIGVLVLAAAVCLSAAFPTATGYVNDFAGVLDAATRTELDALIRDTERKTSAEIAVATVPSLDGLTVEEYANKLFGQWGIGKKGANNGVLFLVAPTEHKMRIEVGYGLEPILPDGLAGEIIRTDCLPAFKNGDYNDGIRRGVEHVVTIVELNHVMTAEERRELTKSDDSQPPAWLMVPFFGLFVTMGFFAVGLGLRSKTGFPLLWGSLFGGIPFAMSLIPFFNAPLWIMAPLAIAMFAMGYMKGGSPTWTKTLRGSGRHAAASGAWVMGSSSSGGSSGSSSSGGGFGGGSSGGGGASGSW